MKLMQLKWVLFLILALVIVISGCSGELSAKIGDIVKVDYTGKLDNGTVFDSSVDRDPLQFTIGSGDVISGFDQAVIGMKPGESKTVTIPAEDAYGPLEYEVNRAGISPDLELEIGLQVYYDNHPCTITDISETTVTLRNDHDLAGEDLTFEIELVEIL